MPSPPTIVLVHGAFADASSWSAVHRALKADGHAVVAPPVPLRGVAADAEHLGKIIDQIEGDVVLVGHAYGGAVITVAGDHPKVKALVYVAAYALDEGESLSQLQGRFPDSALAGNLRLTPFAGGSDGTDVSIEPHAFPDIFAADLPRETSEFMAVAQRPLAASAFEEAAPAAAWKIKPSYGLVPTADTTINPDVHRFGYERAAMTIVEVEGASHAVPLSEPAVVADLVGHAVASL